MHRGTRRRVGLSLAGLLLGCAVAPAQEVLPGPTVYMRTEVLRWQIQDAPLPVPLLTSTYAGGASSRVLFGGQSVGFGTLPAA